MFRCRICGNQKTNKFENFYACSNCGVLFQKLEQFTCPIVKLVKLSKNAQMPKKAHINGDVAYDLFSINKTTILPGKIVKIETGIAIELPAHYEAQVRPRSGNSKKGLLVANAPGTIDTIYRGDVSVLLFNSTNDPWEVEIGDRVAQLLITPKIHIDLVEVDSLNETDRGVNGFGSTGT